MAVLMEEAFWANTYYSVARFYGGVNVKDESGKTRSFLIVNKEGNTLEELSDPGSKCYVGDGMAIPPGEPADLIDKDFITFYKKMGREKFIEILKENNHIGRSTLIALYKEAVKKHGKPKH